jgi:hypothetical protein
MMPLVRNPIRSFNLILTQRVAVLEAVGRCVRNAIGRALRTAWKPHVGVRDFLETVIFLKGSIIFDVAHNFPCALVVITGTPFDQKLGALLATSSA